VRIFADSEEFFVILANRYGFIVKLSCRFGTGAPALILIDRSRSAAGLFSDRYMQCTIGEDRRVCMSQPSSSDIMPNHFAMFVPAYLIGRVIGEAATFGYGLR
jgi:hypothetical protein